MIALPKNLPEERIESDWQTGFLELLPRIIRHARFATRHMSQAAREEILHELVCHTLFAYARLCKLGKSDLAYPSVLVRYGIAQLRSGRRAGVRINSRDVLSQVAQRARGLNVVSLHTFDTANGEWQELVVEDRRSTPADIAATRIDFAEWFRSLQPRTRQITARLSIGESTSAVAKRFKISNGRVSQLRRELASSWESFQNQPKRPRLTRCEMRNSHIPISRSTATAVVPAGT